MGIKKNLFLLLEYSILTREKEKKQLIKVLSILVYELESTK